MLQMLYGNGNIHIRQAIYSMAKAMQAILNEKNTMENDIRLLKSNIQQSDESRKLLQDANDKLTLRINATAATEVSNAAYSTIHEDLIQVHHRHFLKSLRGTTRITSTICKERTRPPHLSSIPLEKN